jgi:hypothetical protein
LNKKYDAIVGSGIPILERVEIPAGMLPPDSQVEIDAKIAAGYFSGNAQHVINLDNVKGRTWYICSNTGMISITRNSNNILLLALCAVTLLH